MYRKRSLAKRIPCPCSGPGPDQHHGDEVDINSAIAEELSLTLALLAQATGGAYDRHDLESYIPQAWLGAMLLAVLRDEQPLTQEGRLYTPAEIEFIWGQAQRLRVPLDDRLSAQLRGRQPGPELWAAVRDYFRSLPIVPGRPA